MPQLTMHKRIVLTILFMMMLISGRDVRAEPAFCVEVQSMAPQCIYYDAKQCRQEAQRSSGVCVVNPKIRSQGYGNSVYCKTSSDGVSQCIYDDFHACNAEAQKDGSVCVRNVRKAKPPAEFQYQNGVYH